MAVQEWMYFLLILYLTFKVFRVKKATWPEDPVLIELVTCEGVHSGLLGEEKRMSYILLFQCLSSRALNWFTDVADTTESGSEFQSLTILALNVFLILCTN